jgi:hypothetical protein
VSFLLSLPFIACHQFVLFLILVTMLFKYCLTIHFAPDLVLNIIHIVTFAFMFSIVVFRFEDCFKSWRQNSGKTLHMQSCVRASKCTICWYSHLWQVYRTVNSYTSVYSMTKLVQLSCCNIVLLSGADVVGDGICHL